MREKFKFLFIPLSIILFLSACNSNENDVDLFQHKGSYVGDNSAVVNSIVNLQGANHFSGLELQTKDEPYGITVNYDWTKSQLDEQETVLNNASYLFTLLQNVDWVSFHFDTEGEVNEYKITRENLQESYGIELNDIENEEDLTNLIQNSLEDEESLNQLLN
ncbi:hypothetical protein JMA_09080 [Jeotgalibacillus malaysiensis]|uniref:DUF4825 domain-containing protein n=1 Tax=Jeotgalibacillus malaysiensis TaxID=1508404 RepID=A0A0B5AIL4_9BACL|nr:DUF4825 domain-containing protein [Jeotgalibacillus malaysiensis]AJD90225.1 hypothetical protein JMA_09080 [Jeotgalibacillus malaysiensis]